MEVIVPILFFVAFLWGIFRVVRFVSYQQACNKSFVKVGKRYNGKSPNGGVKYSFFFSKPTLSFPYRNTFCQLRARRSRAFGSKVVTEFRIHIKQPLPNFEISTDDLRHHHATNDLKLDDPQFQNKFRIGTDTPSELNKVLTSPVCWQLEQLRLHTGNAHLSVSCRRDELHIKKPGVITDYQQLDDFVRYALQLYDQMQLAKAKGIDFVNDNSATVIDDVNCPICSEDIIEDMVVCTRCKTPHCRDCWHYNGQCATFACGEKRFMQVG